MTLSRTRHRREARKRAKARKSEPASKPKFFTPEWVTRETIACLRDSMRFAKSLSE